MIRLAVSALEPGMVLSAPIPHPAAPDRILLNAGFRFDETTLRQLDRFPVYTVWIQHPGFDFVDERLNDVIPRSRVQLYESVKKSFSDMGGRTTAAFNLYEYRTVVSNLICSLVGNKDHAVFAERVLQGEGELFGHSANVAYLALLIGMRLKSYIAAERKYVEGARAEDLTNLGIGAMLHDVGKLDLEEDLHACHVIDPCWQDPAYQSHSEKGYRRLKGSLEATAVAAVLHHHQRFDGWGFPALRSPFQEREERRMAGSKIHIFARMVAVANAIDALISSFQKQNLPIIAALAAVQREPWRSMFDPVILRAALKCIPPFPLRTCVQLSDGRKAVVVDLNEAEPCRPRVRILESDDEAGARASEEIDLSAPGAPSIESEGGRPVGEFLDWEPLPTVRAAASAAPSHSHASLHNGSSAASALRGRAG